jgi:hypothetical protein
MLNSAQQAAIIAAAVFLLAFFGLATMRALNRRPPPAAERHPIETKAEGAVDGNQSADSDPQHSETGLAGKHQEPATKMNESPERSKEEKENNHAALVKYTYRLMAFTAVLAVSTVFLTVATLGLWTYASEQARDMNESINIIKTQADEMKRQSIAAERSFCEALPVEPTTGRRMAGAPSHPRSSHRSDAVGGGGTIQVGTICRVAAS